MVQWKSGGPPGPDFLLVALRTSWLRPSSVLTLSFVPLALKSCDTPHPSEKQASWCVWVGAAGESQHHPPQNVKVKDIWKMKVKRKIYWCQYDSWSNPTSSSKLQQGMKNMNYLIQYMRYYKDERRNIEYNAWIKHFDVKYITYIGENGPAGVPKHPPPYYSSRV